MKVLDLFSGIGGFSIGLEKAGFETVAFCEIEDYPRAVLRKHWPDTPIYRDIKQLTAEQLRADGIVPDVICGGYPCQPFSVAGKQLAEQDERHLWPEVFRLIRSIRPRWVICENVSGHIKLGFDQVATSLEDEGYAVWPFIIPACSVDAPHKRDRLYFVAHAQHDGRASSTRRRGSEEAIRQKPEGQDKPLNAKRASSLSTTEGLMAYTDSDDRRDRSCTKSQDRQAWVEHRGSGKRQLVGESSQDVADTDSFGLQGCAQKQISRVGNIQEQSQGSGTNFADGWPVEPSVGRVANGVSNRSHRIKALGNAVVPQIPEIIGQTIMRYEAEMGRGNYG
jgi:DNA (cytosine-5)-methyltransferase 1